MDKILVQQIKDLYALKQKEFENRYLSFKNILKYGTDKEIFEEMCYCLCTPREKAKNAKNAISFLSKKDHKILINGNFSEIDKALSDNGIALHPIKAERIIKNRNIFYPNTKNILLSEYIFSDITETRKKLSCVIDGFGLKESSHFLRNIGLGDDIAILDTHIKKQLIKYGIIDESENNFKSITKNKYYQMENSMRKFANHIGVPMWMLDMLFMYIENNEIEK